FGSSALLCPLLVYGWLGLPRWGLTGSAVAARFGAAALAAHQVVLQLWGLLALVLDSLAIAAQSLVGAALGAGDAGHAKAVAWRVTAFSLLAAGILAAALGLGSSVLPGLFTDDRSVLAAIGVPWWFMVVQLPFAGIVFAVDGVLLGAGDAAFMRTATVASALVGFLPLVWLSLAYGWGLAGIWSGLGTFIVLRLIFVGWRAYSGRWAVTGAA
ncbi:MATE family efflux transporter, partial [Mycobacterium tuberculosis]|uniref:MATE family efflux transporter n=2 Tax=Mycobacterium tuberculosis TaxID=1773 RepID=UPI0020738A1A